MAGRGKEVALAVLGLTVFGTAVIVFGALRDDVRPIATPSVPGAESNALARPAVPAAAPAVAQAPALVPAPPAASAAPAATPPAAPRPAFDIVRVEPTGESVIAGRAAPGATIELLRNGAVHDRATADAAGQFSFVPPPLPPGASEVSLRASAEGKALASEQSVTVVVAARRDERPMVALASPDQPTAILSAPPAPAPATSSVAPAVVAAAPVPAPAPAATLPAAPRAGVRVETVEAEEGGQLYVSGRAAPGATVRLYLNETHVASGAATPEGRIAFSIRRGVTPGEYRVRLDEAGGATGSVLSRAEVTFAMPVPAIVAQAPPAADSVTRPPVVPPLPPLAAVPAPGRPAEAALGRTDAAVPTARGAQTASADPGAAGDPGLVVVPRIDTATVSRGDSLWRISRRIYGRGVRYTVIYDANLQQIRNPNRIYPGQIFVVPGEGATVVQ